MANKRRRLYKTRKRASSDSERQDLIRETQKMINEANQRLKSLSRHYDVGTWASKKLRNYLETSNIRLWSGRAGGSIKQLSSDMSITKLRAINKVVTNFLNSQTSTRRGIEAVKRKQIQSIKTNLSDFDEEELTEKDAQTLYELFGNNSFQKLADKIGASELQVEIIEARENEDSEDDFIRRIEKYISVLNDDDLLEATIDVYNKFVK